MIRAALAMTLVLAACGNGQQEPTTTTTSAPPPMEEETGSVSVRDTTLGMILVDPDGFTMYVFTSDPPGESVCYESCAVLWPPVPGDVAIGSELNSSMFGSITRTDGSIQLTVNGQPLYLWVSDAQPGDVTGQDVDNVWFVVDAEGRKVGAPSGPTDQEEDPYGY